MPAAKSDRLFDDDSSSGDETSRERNVVGGGDAGPRPAANFVNELSSKIAAAQDKRSNEPQVQAQPLSKPENPAPKPANPASNTVGRKSPQAPLKIGSGSSPKVPVDSKGTSREPKSIFDSGSDEDVGLFKPSKPVPPKIVPAKTEAAAAKTEPAAAQPVDPVKSKAPAAAAPKQAAVASKLFDSDSDSDDLFSSKPSKVGETKVGVAKVGESKVGVAKVGVAKVGEAKVGVAKAPDTKSGLFSSDDESPSRPLKTSKEPAKVKSSLFDSRDQFYKTPFCRTAFGQLFTLR
jgi:hypothetical protein